MARNNEDSRRSERTREASERRSGGFSDNVRSRPIAAAAIVTAAAAAGAYFFSRRSGSGSGPLMKWGQSDDQDSTRAGQGSTSSDRVLETAGTAPSASAGTSPAAGSPTKSSGSGLGSKQPATGLDSTSQAETKTGAISY